MATDNEKRDSEQIMEDVFGTPGGDSPAPTAPNELAEVGREYAQLRSDRLGLEAKAKKLKEAEKDAEDRFLSLMAQSGIDSIRITIEETLEVNGRSRTVPTRYTLAPARRVIAKLKAGKDAVIEALKRSKRYAYIVKEDYSVQTLNSLMKEILGDGKRELPPVLAEVMEPDEVWTVSMTKSDKGSS